MDGHFNRTYAAAVRKAIFSHPAPKGVLVVHVGAGVGVLSIAAAQARPEWPTTSSRARSRRPT